MSLPNLTEQVQILDDLNDRHQAENAAVLLGDEATFKLRLETAIQFHKLGGSSCPELVKRAKRNGAADAPRPKQTDEHWLAPGLTGVNLNELSGDEKARMSDRMSALAEVMVVAAWKAESLGGITSEAVTVDVLADQFPKPRQQAVRKAKKDRAAGLAATAADEVADSDIEGDEKVVDFTEALTVLKGQPDLAKLHLRLDQPGQLFVLAGYRDEDGDHIAAQISIDPEVLKAALTRPDLTNVDGRINGISDHLLLSRQLLPARASEVRENPDDPQSRFLPAVRATLVHDNVMETSVYMVGSPEMLVLTRLHQSVFGGDYRMLNANSRNAFEKNVAEPAKRFTAAWEGHADGELQFKRGKGGARVALKMIPAAKWGSSKRRDVWAHRLGRWNGKANVCLSADQLRRVEEEYLHSRDARKTLPVVVSLEHDGVTFTLGKAKPVKFEGVSGGGEFKSQSITVPARELGEVLELALSRAKDGKLVFDADPAGVLEVRFADHGATHSVYLSKLTDAGARENGSVFQRYTKADFAPVEAGEAA